MNTSEGNKSVSADSVELLRSILEAQQSRHVTREEAAEIGESLLTFFETLGSEAQEDE
jgi:hypothetical protein